MSRAYFDFSSLIRQHESSFKVISHKEIGYDEAGDWIEGREMRTTYTGAIIAFRESKVFRSEGKITAQDRRLYMLQPLPHALMGAEVIFKGRKYMIESELENAEFTGVYSYHLRYISAFEEVDA